MKICAALVGMRRPFGWLAFSLERRRDAPPASFFPACWLEPDWQGNRPPPRPAPAPSPHRRPAMRGRQTPWGPGPGAGRARRRPRPRPPGLSARAGPRRSRHPPPPAVAARFAVPPGLEALPQGGLTVAGRGGRGSATARRLDSPLAVLGQSLAAGPPGARGADRPGLRPGRRCLRPPGGSAWPAPWRSKQALAAGGLPATQDRISVPLGRTADAVDAVDVQPPSPFPFFFFFFFFSPPP